MSPQIEVLERSAVPTHFPQFRTVAALAHLAHRGQGPAYTLVGGRAWYQISDIREWLERNKRCGAAIAGGATESSGNRGSRKARAKRGRPTKAEQFRRLANPPSSAPAQ